jgi:hypothetical protein
VNLLYPLAEERVIISNEKLEQKFRLRRFVQSCGEALFTLRRSKLDNLIVNL